MLLLLSPVLLCIQFVHPVLCSSPSSDLWLRSTITGGLRYSVYPNDVTNTVQTVETGALLQTLCGSANVVTVEQDDVIDSWIIDAKNDSHVLQAIAALEGVSRIEQQNDTESPSDTTEHRKLAIRDLPHYEAYAKNGTDTQKTEEFLQSQVPEGTKILQYKDDGKVVAWYRFSLSPEAKEAVENYEGIEKLYTASTKRYNRALPANTNPSTLLPTSKTLSESDALWRRSGTWVKQEKADKALVMDSQFP
jgi:hypothetical protein